MNFGLAWADGRHQLLASFHQILASPVQGTHGCYHLYMSPDVEAGLFPN